MQLITNQVHKLIHAHGYTFGVFVSLFAFFFFAGGLVVANGQTLGPNDSHVVNLYVDGEERIIPTRAATVEELLAKSGVTLRENDLVEPSLKAEITDDNFSVQVYRAKPIVIIDGETEKRVMTPYTSEAVIAEKAGIQTYPEDNLAFAAGESFVSEQILGKKLLIDRATPITLSLYGSTPATYRTQATTVGEFLNERGIAPEQGATLSPSADTPLSDNLPVFISKIGKQVVTVDEEVDFAIDSTADPTKPMGQVTILNAGKKGKKQVVYELEIRDGREYRRVKLQEVVTVQPVKQTQTKGTKNTIVTGDRVAWMLAAGISESDFFYVDYIVGREGGWNGTTKWNRAGSGAYGLCQALPASKMASAGSDYMTNPVTQLKWCAGYAKGRYGSWEGAHRFWLNNNWW